MNIIDDVYFTECPLCSSKLIRKKFMSIQKDMSEEGYLYNQCSVCFTYYAGNGTIAQLNDFYAKLPPYQSTSSKSDIVETMVNDLKIDAKSRILDIGCGSGAWALPFLPFCGNMTCVDTDSNAIEILRKSVPEMYKNKISCFAMDCDQYLDTTTENNFDIVLSMFSFEHQLYPVKFLKQVHKILSPNGIAIVLIPSGDALQLKLLGNAFYWAQAPWHTFLPTKKGFFKAAERAGFKKNKIYSPSISFFSWFWLRGLSDKTKTRSFYNKLRKYKWFIRFDMSIDKLFDRVSNSINKPSYRFFIITK